MLSKLFGEKCTICKHKCKKPSKYMDDIGNEMKVCVKCVSYAERRAYRKIH
ncbi:hypothetical protein Bcell_0895 [Evansella cellulosilytica DSM 2522]|uniref:Uncharacterized protein n=1 Tax=Evansella cellulosilytica (strain ATCC 21833 / DSM 2522 / FERM P-1141 / JCM 9156 / N-4) TaxID=649639 RepID=E6U1C4_EVAC2|nr:hypothetical protein Bcell_0895 [Evansella cellulosilytica DSM 2522]